MNGSKGALQHGAWQQGCMAARVHGNKNTCKHTKHGHWIMFENSERFEEGNSIKNEQVVSEIPSKSFRVS